MASHIIHGHNKRRLLYSPSELFYGRRICAKIDACMPLPAYILKRRQLVKQQKTYKSKTMELKIGTPHYDRKYSQNTEEEKWVPGVIAVFGNRSFNVKIVSNGEVWRRLLEQLRPRHTTDSPSEENTSGSEAFSRDLTDKQNINSRGVSDTDATVQTPRRSNRQR